MSKALQVKTSFLCIMAMLGFLIGCEKKPIEPSNNITTTLNTSISIPEAKKWATENLSTLTNPTVAETTKGRGYSSTEPLWDKAAIHNSANGKQYLTVPLSYKGATTRRIVFSDTSVLPYLLPEPQLFLFKNTAGQYQAQVQEFDPNESYVKTHTGLLKLENFSGKIIFHNWEGQFVRGIVYQDGQPVKSLVRASGDSALNRNTTVSISDKNSTANRYETRVHIVYEQASDCVLSDGVGSTRRITRTVDTIEGAPEPTGEPLPGTIGYNSCSAWYTVGQYSYLEQYWVDDTNYPNPNTPGSNALVDGIYVLINLAGSSQSRALAIDGNSQSDQALAIINTQPGNPSVAWRLTNTTGGYYTITSINSGLALDVQWGSSAVGTPIWQWPANGGLAQQWQIDFVGSNQGDPLYKITSPISGLVLDIGSGIPSSGAGVVQKQYTSASTQHWNVLYIGN